MNNLWYVLSELGQLGFIIAIPVAILAYFGAKLDKIYQTSPLFLLIGIVFSIITSSIVIYRKIKKLESTEKH
ncbi:hypothetical protein A3F08_01950 [Candidatus Berkelbacteria bacterium RIFCSPHIGHO2_12_FULL_36_9]|uniref:AtpZ/AtpI family protein n=1 Tax=Candidatus Berkelbacteria bacterium RIFCSPHIGHO2_12_FULL_36_9 TaxID=1797469 RepID=A0A1F5EGZ0_9BACT|nr:MAG: hypothetical protein A3F08_01950 [Candidatus Berkelbacteria bacterium RIFCSPHIGHO2_12_FULL_36_9]